MDHGPHVLRGITYLVCALLTFSCLDTTAKWLGQYYASPTVVWVRYAIQAALMVVVLAPRMGWGLVRTRNLRMQVLRGTILAASSLVFFEAIRTMPLPEASAISFLSPMLIAALAGPILHERVTRSTWVALGLGFTGVLFIVRPGTDVFTWTSALPFACALMIALYQVLTRKMAGIDPALTTLFYPALIGALVVPVAFPGSMQLPHGAAHAVLFCLVGLLGGIGHFLLIKAFENAPASVLAPFVYVQLAGALVLSTVVFGHFPDGWSLFGMAVIAGSGLSIALRYWPR